MGEDLRFLQETANEIGRRDRRIAALEAEVETLRAIKMLDSDQHDVSDKLLDLHNNEKWAMDAHNLLLEDYQKLEQALRDCLHVIDTSEGLWATDKPDFPKEADVLLIGEIVAKFGMSAHRNTYWRQSFSDNEGVKRAREMVSR